MDQVSVLLPEPYPVFLHHHHRIFEQQFLLLVLHEGPLGSKT
ncbi:MAG: hypothetical protein GX956_02985 [Firmicutes bacterium]|nr:hypothetical protein [Bacillota bacterium]